MAVVYTYTDLERDVKEMLRGTDASAINLRQLLNRAVRQVALDIDLRSTKRRAQLSPNLARRQYDYTAPSDLKGLGVIDLAAQVNRGSDQSTEFSLTTPEEFDRQKTRHKNVMARNDFNSLTILRVSGLVDGDKQVIHNLDSISDNGTWAADSDNTAANNLTRDAVNFVQGSASLNFDVDTSGTTAQLQNTSLTQVDLSEYTDGSAIFVWVYIPATTNLSSFTLRWGNDSDTYHERTVTTTNEGLSFYVGWNLLRFDIDDGVSDAGTVTDSDIDYVRFGMTLSAALTNADTDFRVDYIVARKGVIHNLYYYSRYLWQDSDSTYIENSTANGDFLNVETEEYDLIIEKAVQLAGRMIRDREIQEEALASYREQKETYEMSYPSERKNLITEYHEFDSLRSNVVVESDLDT